MRPFGNVIFWKSKKQNSVAKSSTAAEYVAQSEAVGEIKFSKSLLEDFDLEIKKPAKIDEDNLDAIAIYKYGNLTKNSKYIEVHYHFVDDCYGNKKIDIVQIGSENNVADILTKALGLHKIAEPLFSISIKKIEEISLGGCNCQCCLVI